jgi:F-type H+-transporting ATPase subunit b
MFTSTLPLANIIDNLRDVGAQTGFTLQQFIAQCIAFIVLCAVLQKFAWKPVATILIQRRKTIEESMANAEKIKGELADAEASRIKVIQKANEQANTIIAEAQKSAAILAERLAKEATAQAQDIVRKAHEASVLERDRLLAELKRDIGSLVVQTTEKIAGKVLTSDDQARLNNETLRHLGAGNN